MDYKEKYEMALEGIQEILSSGEDSIKMSRLQLRLQGIFPELKESEDEKMVKFIKNQLFNIKKTITENYKLDVKLTKAIDWLEKQGQHANFLSKIQVGDKVTRNEDGVLVNLSQLERVAKPAENKGMNLVEEEMTPFQKKVFCIIDTTIEEEQGLKQVCDELFAKHRKEKRYDRQRKEAFA